MRSALRVALTVFIILSLGSPAIAQNANANTVQSWLMGTSGKDWYQCPENVFIPVSRRQIGPNPLYFGVNGRTSNTKCSQAGPFSGDTQSTPVPNRTGSVWFIQLVRNISGDCRTLANKDLQSCVLDVIRVCSKIAPPSLHGVICNQPVGNKGCEVCMSAERPPPPQ